MRAIFLGRLSTPARFCDATHVTTDRVYNQYTYWEAAKKTKKTMALQIDGWHEFNPPSALGRDMQAGLGPVIICFVTCLFQSESHCAHTPHSLPLFAAPAAAAGPVFVLFLFFLFQSKSHWVHTPHSKVSGELCCSTNPLTTNQEEVAQQDHGHLRMFQSSIRVSTYQVV